VAGETEKLAATTSWRKRLQKKAKQAAEGNSSESSENNLQQQHDKSKPGDVKWLAKSAK